MSESVRKIDPGPNSGEMALTLMKDPGAGSYQVAWAVLGAGGVPGSWTSKAFADLRPPVLITGLTPGTTYVFQARAVTKKGYSDWGESVTRIGLTVAPTQALSHKREKALFCSVQNLIAMYVLRFDNGLDRTADDPGRTIRRIERNPDRLIERMDKFEITIEILEAQNSTWTAVNQLTANVDKLIRRPGPNGH